MPPVPVADLPFTLVHGAWVWKVLVVLAIALALGVQIGARWLRARRTARGDAREWSGRATALHDGDVIVRATVRGGTATTLAVGEARFHHRDDGLRFEAGGEPIAVDGEVDVVHGTRAATRRRGLPRTTPAPLRNL